MMLSRLLCRFAWYRRLRGGTWHWHNSHWIRVEIEVIDPLDLSIFDDDVTLRPGMKEFFLANSGDRYDRP